MAHWGIHESGPVGLGIDPRTISVLHHSANHKKGMKVTEESQRSSEDSNEWKITITSQLLQQEKKSFLLYALF